MDDQYKSKEKLLAELQLLRRQIAEQNQVEEDLRASEQLLQVAIDSLPQMQKLSNALAQTADTIIITDCEGAIEYVNAAFEQVTGYSKDEVIGATPRLLKSGQHSPQFYESLWAKILAGEIFRATFVNRRKNGQLYYEDRTITPLKNREGSITHFISTGRDITARRLSEKILRHSKERLAEAQRIAHLGNYEWYIRTGRLYASDEIYRIYGTPIQEFKTHETILIDLVHPDDRDVILQAIDEALHQKKPFDLDYRIVRPDGQIRALHSQARVSFDRAGQPVRMIGTVQDITERKRLEEQLEAVYQLGRELTLLRSEKAIAERVLKTATNALYFERVNFGIVDASAAELVYRYRLIGNQFKSFHLRLPLSGNKGIGVAVVRHKRAINVPDTGQEPRFVQSNQGTHSELCVPMKIGNRVIGVLDVESNQYNHFKLADQRLLQSLADQTAVALENARLYAETQRRTKELAALHRAGRAMASSLDLNVVLEQTLSEVKMMLEAEGASVLLFEPDRECLIFAAAVSPGTEKMIGQQVPLSTSIAGWVVQTKQSLLVNDAQNDQRFYKGVDNLTGLTTRSLLAVPLMAKEKIIGVIEVINKFNKNFSKYEVELLEALSSSAAIAIENAWLYEAEREQLRRLRQSQTQLIQVEKMAALGRLIGSIAHEINNPIQAIQNCLSLLVEELNGPQDLEKLLFYSDIAKTELDRIAAIVRRMREFYRPSRQRSLQISSDSAIVEDFYRLDPEALRTVDLHAILENVLQLANKQLQNSRIKVERYWPDQMPTVQVSPDHLKQVFLNLILNAADAMAQEGGILSIKSRLDEIELSDNRSQRVICIDFKDTGEGIPPELLNRLFEPLFTTKEQGSGFGLFTSYQIVKAHRGQISVKSQLGTGTVITVCLPLKQD